MTSEKNVFGKPKRNRPFREDLVALCKLGSPLPRTKTGSSIMAAPAVVRAKDPTQSRCGESGITSLTETRPKVGLRPTTPQSAEGMRMEPPVSVPMPPEHNAAATAAAE